MKSFPLIRRSKWSNEHLMTAVFLVSLLYLLPTWLRSPASITDFIFVLLTALIVDAIINYIRFKRPVCAVSAAVTAGILEVLTPGVPLWGRLLGIAIALIIGKHIWGGTGKNIFNPAIMALLLISAIFKLEFPLLPVTLWLLPAMILSIPFLLVRPYAGIGLIAGMIVSLLMHQQLNLITFN